MCQHFIQIPEIQATYFCYNPSVGTSCKLVSGNSYCVEENYGIAVPTTTSAKPTTTSAPGNGITTPNPIQAGMVTNCKIFYLAQSDDSCSGILAKYGITLSRFYKWNPAVGSTCTSLWLSTYVCVRTTTTTRSPPKTTTTTGNGITTRSPIQTGMATNYNGFHKVQANDACGTIASSNGISLSDFYAWNPAVGASCSSLWADTYMCVETIESKTGAATTTAQKPTTTAGNGISTPIPFQSGMAGNCRKLKQVASGDECGKIATGAGIALADFYKWNPGVGSSCASLWLGYCVCVGVS